MSLPNEPHLQRLQFYVTAAYPCGYLENRMAQSMIAAPHHLIDSRAYDKLIALGFRRSGKFSYRPHCDNCQACVPVRLIVDELKPTRSQRRAWSRHENLSANIVDLSYSEEHYALYSAYQKSRHPGGGMDADSSDQYRNFLTQSNVETILIEFRENGQLRMVSVVDCLEEGLSAVYTFYDPSIEGASYGTYNVLWLARWCRARKVPYLYLGYWIAASRKMAYKMNFSPIEGLIDGTWTRDFIPAKP